MGWICCVNGGIDGDLGFGGGLPGRRSVVVGAEYLNGGRE